MGVHDEGHVAPGYRDVTRRAGWEDTRTLLGFALVVLIGLGLFRVGSRTASGVAIDLRHAFNGVPEGIATVLLGLILATYLLMVLVGPVWLAISHRFALLGRGVLGALVGLVGYGLVIRVPSVKAWLSAIEASAQDLGTPQAWEIAAFAAVTAVARPAMTARWSRAMWTMLVLLALTRVVSTSAGPIGVLLAIGAGGMSGALLLLALGRTVPELTAEGLAALLANAGTLVTEVHPTPLLANGWDFGARSADGRQMQVRVVDDHEWHADRLRRGYRRLRWRQASDESPFSSPVRAVTNEAMVGLLADARGVRVAQVQAVVAGLHGEAVLAVCTPDGPTLSELAAEALTDEVLDAAWQQVDALATARIAVRTLTLDHLVLADAATAEVAVVDLNRAVPAAPDGVLAGDVAELLAATSTRVGVHRAVAAAYRVLGQHQLEAALSRLVPEALSAQTRAAVKAAGGLSPLVTEVSSVTGVDEPQFERIERFRPRTLLMAAMLGLAVYVLAPQLTDLPSLVQAIQHAHWGWVGAVLAASALTYVGAALGLAGGTPGRVPVGQAAAVAVAASFVASFAPPGVGQVGLNVRYLQKRGFPTSIAASASAAKEVAVVVVHLTILAGFAIWAGSTDALAGEFTGMPSPTVIAVAVGGTLSLVGIVVALPWGREVIRTRVVPAARSSAQAMGEVVASPVKVMALFGGVTLLPMGYALALYFAVRSVGVDVSFVAVALVSLTAGALATAAPTPGGVGAVEAVLLASLTGLGIASETALAAVLVYRVATFWLPIAPGAVVFRVLSGRDVL